ncbi:30S ribosomal protein S17 [Candidatus Uhrbacteria bacterium]|nr:30S ribosomal protein S17 [Candidatus Uhrbacteria bacterium]
MAEKMAKRRRLYGVITSDKMAKTKVVEVTRAKEHPKYKKQYTESKKYKAHDEKNEYRLGDRVAIEETRPISRDKHWRIIAKV